MNDARALQACSEASTISPHLEVVEVEALVERALGRHGERRLVHALGHALLVADRARSERLHRLVSVQVTAPDLHAGTHALS